MGQSVNKKYKIFIGQYEVCGYFQSLKNGFRELGIDADFIELSPHRFNYSQNNEKSFLIKFWRLTNNWRVKVTKNNIILKLIVVAINIFTNTILCVRLAIKYNVLIFSYGSSITNSNIELWFYKLLKIKILFVFLGSDSRPPFLNSKYCHTPSNTDWNHLNELTVCQKEKILRIEKYASFLIDHLPQAHFHEKPFIDVLQLGIPVYIEIPDESKFNQIRIDNSFQIDKNKEYVRILHAPSDLDIKGTDKIQSVIDKLVNKGYKINFILLHNVSHKTVLEEIQKSDFIIDELYSDSILGILGSEAAYFRKPTVSAGFFIGELASSYPKDSLPETLFVKPEEIEHAIEKMILDVNFRNDLGNKVHDFVINNWSMKQVAKNYLLLLDGNIPESWWRDPYRITYLNGNLPIEKLTEIIRGMVNKFGIKSLQLSDKPLLEKLYIDLIN